MMDRSKLKKAIIFDCDNTLWDGVIGEGMVRSNVEIQQDIIFLANRGVIVGLCSKNNEEDVLNELENQVLKESYISVKRINWKDKVSNLKEIAQELNIGLDAIVFVDDSDFELSLVRELLPEVLSIYPKDLMSTALEYFDTSGDFSKTQQYKDNYKRAKFQEQFTDIEDYLASLQMRLSIKINDFSQIGRITELTQKTNQFNLTTRRYTEEQIKNSMTNPSRVYSLSVSDIFGDNGLTGVCIVSALNMDVFLLSCRILGRGIEFAFMDFIIKDLLYRKQPVLVGSYFPTSKNIIVSDFLSRCGFEYIETEDDSFSYIISLSEYKFLSAKYFKYEQ